MAAAKQSTTTPSEWGRHITDEPLYIIESERFAAGAYATVHRATHRVNSLRYAVKISKTHDDHKAAVNESKLLQNLSHPNIVQAVDYYTCTVGNMLKCHLVMNAMDTDLARVLYSGNTYLTPMHISTIMRQLLQALAYIHARDITHCDIKPSNCLINNDYTLRLADFGMSVECKGPIPFSYTVTRWYRAPELLVGCSEYTTAVDMWAVGCMFAEMLTGRKNPDGTALYYPVFRGSDTRDQLQSIFRRLGTPTEGMWPKLVSQPCYKYIKQWVRYPPTTSTWFITPPSAVALDLLSQLLTYDPERRITAETALRHRYFSSS